MITLYKHTKITPERNAMVDNLGDYLATCESTTIECQYIKPDLDVEIKLDMPQEVLDKPEYNYAAINNGGELRYYFIMNMTWVAKHTVKLILSIDSVNTFMVGRDLEFSDKTTITREHRDRFKVIRGSKQSVSRIIDENDEGIEATQRLYQDRKVIENDKDINWYLMYRTRKTLTTTDLTNPVECYAFASEPLRLDSTGWTPGGVEIGPDDIEEGKHYFCLWDENPEGQVQIRDTVYTLNTSDKRGVEF